VLATYLDSVSGVVDHGLFPPTLVHEILVGRGEKVQRLVPPT
jgi:ribose 5-phosphate isomerase